MKQGSQLVPAFKNAIYWSNEKHWKWAVHPNEREKASFLKENILPIQESGQLQWIPEIDGYAFSESVQMRFVYGHTEAMMLPQVKYKERTIVFMADLLPSAAHIPLPYVMAYDVQPLLTLQEKKRFLSEALENKYILFFEHDSVVECCEVEETEKGIRAGRSLGLHEI